MKIALVIPPSPFLIDDRVFPFLGPLQIGALARQEGHDVKVLDLTGYKQRNPDQHPTIMTVMEEAKRLLAQGTADRDLVGFYSLAAQHPLVVELYKSLRENGINCTTALGGPHANTAPDRCLKDGFDYIVVSDQGGGGGEPGFLELLERVKNRSEDKIIKIPSRIQLNSGKIAHQNDRWPLPARDLIDLNSYTYFVEGERATSIVTGTGCPFACIFCSHWGGYRKLETKSPARVAEEIQSIRKDYGWRGIMFYDDEINLRPDFESEFLPMLKTQDIVWRAFFKNGPNLTTSRIFETMANSGCVQMCTGAESASPEILKTIKKGATLENNTDFVRLCVKNKIKPKVFCQVGLPGETVETIQALRDWMVQMAKEGLSDADVSITTPYEGTPLYDTPDKFDIHFNKEELDYSKEMILYKGIPGEYKSFVSHKGLPPEEIVKARQWVEDEFRLAAGLTPLMAKDDG